MRREPGSTCDDQNRTDATYAPVVAQHYIPAPPPAPVTTEAPGEVGREFVLAVAERVQTLLGALVPGTTG